MATIRVRSTVEAKVTVKVEGCPGPSCESLAAGVVAALGVKGQTQETEEYYLVPEQEVEH